MTTRQHLIHIVESAKWNELNRAIQLSGFIPARQQAILANFTPQTGQNQRKAFANLLNLTNKIVTVPLTKLEGEVLLRALIRKYTEKGISLTKKDIEQLIQDEVECPGGISFCLEQPTDTQPFIFGDKGLVLNPEYKIPDETKEYVNAALDLINKLS